MFVETKRKADDLTREMRTGGWPALCIHGDKEQRERNWVLSGKLFKCIQMLILTDLPSEFKNGNVPILLATDVAGMFQCFLNGLIECFNV